MKTLKSILYFLSKTDTDVLNHCGQNAKNTRMSLGAFVFFTGFFAFISGTYAISTVFLNENQNVSIIATIFCGLLGLVYSMMIISFDREIVAVTNTWAALIRLPLAILIGIVVAFPLEMKLLEGRIDKQLQINSFAEKLEEFNEKMEKELKSIASDFKIKEIDQSFDLLSKFETLEELKKEDYAFYLSWGLRLLFILIETFPALIKLFLKPTEYDAILESRRRLNIQSSYKIANHGLEEIDQNVNNAYNPTYVSAIKHSVNLS